MLRLHFAFLTAVITPSLWGQFTPVSTDQNLHLPGASSNDLEVTLALKGSVAVAAWHGYSGSGTLRGFDIMFARSSDAGTTWAPTKPLNTDAATDTVDDAECTIDAGDSNVWICVWQRAFGLQFARSVDNGNTWQPALPLFGSQSGLGTRFNGNASLSTDRAGNWIVVWQSLETVVGGIAIGTDADILYCRSSDNGATWTSPAILNSNAATDGAANDFYPVLRTDSQGTWICVWVQNGAVRCSRSTDNGQSWSPAATIGTGMNGVGYSSRLALLGADGLQWWAAWIRGASDLDDVFVTRSDDEGLSWSTPAALVSTNERELDVQLAKLSGGRVLATWQTQTKPFEVNLFASEFSPVANQWSSPERLFRNESFEMVARETREGPRDQLVSAYVTSSTTRVNRFAWRDRNANFVSDSIDIVEGYSLDCNANDVPDEVEVLPEPSFTSSVETGVPESGPFDIGDMNNDGYYDAIISSSTIYSYNIQILGNNAGILTSGLRLLGAAQVGFVGKSRWVDVNLDGWLDIVEIRENRITVWPGRASGIGTPIISLNNYLRNITDVVEIDGDGRPDIVTLMNGIPTMFKGTGDGRFSTNRVHLADTSERGRYFLFSDLDRDRDPDLILLEWPSAPQNSCNVRVLVNDGIGRFSNQTTIGFPFRITEAATGDLNGDGYPEVLLANDDGGRDLVSLSNSNGYLTEGPSFRFGAFVINPVIRDLNGDGLADLVAFVTGRSVLQVRLQIEHGVFLPYKAVPLGSSPHAVDLVDVDRNGLVDILYVRPALGALPTPAIGVLYNTTAPSSLDCNADGRMDACHGTAGCAADCNSNNRADVADIRLKISQDCDLNQIPDECQLDSDSDGRIDSCDNCPNVANADQSDFDNNGTGDACQLPPLIRGWRSVRSHSFVGPLPIDLHPSRTGNGVDGPTTETRQGGLQRVEIELTRPVTLADASGVVVDGHRTVNGVMDPLMAFPLNGVTMSNENTLVLAFNQGTIPPESCIRITLWPSVFQEGLAGDRDMTVRVLQGDVSMNGEVALNDAIIPAKNVNVAANAAPAIDVNLTGAVINLGDALAVKGRVTSSTWKALCP